MQDIKIKPKTSVIIVNNSNKPFQNSSIDNVILQRNAILSAGASRLS